MTLHFADTFYWTGVSPADICTNFVFLIFKCKIAVGVNIKSFCQAQVLPSICAVMY